MSKRVLILGIGGMDGSYCAEQLVKEGCEVHGLVRRSSADNLWRIRGILDRITIHSGDLLDIGSLRRVFSFHIDEVYNFADQDHVDFSFKTPEYSNVVTTGGVVNILEAIRAYKLGLGHTKPRILQPLSATMFGNAPPPQNEQTPLAPASPYACAKAAAWYWCQHYRREYGLQVSCPIFFNHDSERRQGDYLLHKIAKQALLVARGEQGDFKTGNPNQRVDIGYAPEYVAAAIRLLRLDNPQDMVIGTGKGWRILDLCQEAFKEAASLSYGYGSGRGKYTSYGISSDDFSRPGGTPTLIADAKKAIGPLYWDPKEDAGSVVRRLVRHYAGKGVG